MAVAHGKTTRTMEKALGDAGNRGTLGPTVASVGAVGRSSPGRELWIDVVKGVGILAVIIGHSGAAISHYLYWFHMPLFFALSGYLFHPPTRIGKSWFAHRARRLLLPYAGFLVLLTLIRHTLMPGVRWSSLPGELPYLIGGGRFLTSLYGVVWFVTALFVTQLLFVGLIRALPRWWQQLLALAVTYGLAHVQAVAWRTPHIPWNADVALLALTYYALGYYAHQLFARIRDGGTNGTLHPQLVPPVSPAASGSPALGQRLSTSLLALVARMQPIPYWLWLAGAWAAALAWVAAEQAGWFHYDLDMKYLVYTHPALDLLIPLTWGTAISLAGWAMVRGVERVNLPAGSFASGRDVESLHTSASTAAAPVLDRLARAWVRILAYLGRQSMPLMYLHFPVNSVLRAHTHDYGPVPFVLVGLGGSLALIWLFERIPFTRRVLLGLPPSSAAGHHPEGGPPPEQTPAPTHPLVLGHASRPVFPGE